MGMNPHFEGSRSVRIAVEARVTRPAHTPLDGTFLAWANPPEGSTAGGDYPFAFDCPDAATHESLELPVVADAQIAAFAQHFRSTRRPAALRRGRVGPGTPLRLAVVHPLRVISPSGRTSDAA